MAEHCFFPSHANNNDNKNSREKLGTTKQIREKHKTLCLAKTSIQAWEATILTNYSYTRRGILEQNPLVTLTKHNPWTQRIFYIFIVWLYKWNYWMWWSSLHRTGFIFVCYAPPVTQKVGKFHFSPQVLASQVLTASIPTSLALGSHMTSSLEGHYAFLSVPSLPFTLTSWTENQERQEQHKFCYFHSNRWATKCKGNV